MDPDQIAFTKILIRVQHDKGKSAKEFKKKTV